MDERSAVAADEMGRPGSADFPIAILGAGFAGIGTAIKLLEAGIESFTIFERASEIGGTWRDNTYPGAACDVPSHVYSFSFEANPEWSRAFAESGEIQDYLLDVVKKYGLRRYLRLNTKIVGAQFDAAKGLWTLTTDGDEKVEARVVCAGVGGLVDPQEPDLEGLQSFRGEIFHTARWNHDIDLTGKNVAVIGTGASAVQVVPSIAPQVAKLRVFQRTPAWVMPKFDHHYSDEARQKYRRSPFSLWSSRMRKYWLSEMLGPMIFMDWPWLSSMAQWWSLKFLYEQVTDPELRRKLTPEFQFGCKRVLISDDYWQTFERENVELISEPIDEVRSEGIETRDDQLHEVDVIILATGFKLGITSAPFPVAGLDGRTLEDAWKQGAIAYKGMSVAGIPNYFTIMGPNTGPGHTSVLVYSEAQISHIVQAIRRIRDGNLRYLVVHRKVMDRYNRGLQKRMKHMVWKSGCKSWYLSSDGENHSLYPGFAAEYVLRARNFNPRDYQLVEF